MRILIFDTETNDQARDFKLEPKADLTNFPFILQLGAKLIDVDINENDWIEKRPNSIKTTTLIEFNSLVVPERDNRNIALSEEAFAIHGITLEDCFENGNNITEVLAMLQGMMSFADVIICHNVAFDKPVVISEALRLGLELRISKNTKIWCSMLNTVETAKIPSVGKARYYGPYKWPKLEELYKYLFGKDMNDFHTAHDAMGDVNATIDCIIELLNRDINLFNKNVC